MEVATTAAHLQGLTSPSLDRDALLARHDESVSHYDDSGQVAWAESAGIHVIRGAGRLSGECLVTVDGRLVGFFLVCGPLLIQLFGATLPESPLNRTLGTVFDELGAVFWQLLCAPVVRAVRAQLAEGSRTGPA
jgi:hypothetical protein